MKITCARIGERRFNRYAKGCFVREFNTLSEMAKWMSKSRRKLFFPKLKQELTQEQIRILNYKIISLLSKKHV